MKTYWFFNLGKRNQGTNILEISIDLQWWVFIIGIQNDSTICSFQFLCFLFLYYKKEKV
jgi:hypothetical protein